MSKVSVEVHSESEIEEIACETYFLLSKGWKRILINSIPGYDELSEKYSIMRYEYVWVKDGAKREVHLDGKLYYDDRLVEVSFFCRNSAYEYENKE